MKAEMFDESGRSILLIAENQVDAMQLGQLAGMMNSQSMEVGFYEDTREVNEARVKIDVEVIVGEMTRRVGKFVSQGTAPSRLEPAPEPDAGAGPSADESAKSKKETRAGKKNL